MKVIFYQLLSYLIWNLCLKVNLKKTSSDVTRILTTWNEFWRIKERTEARELETSKQIIAKTFQIAYLPQKTFLGLPSHFWYSAHVVDAKKNIVINFSIPFMNYWNQYFKVNAIKVIKLWRVANSYYNCRLQSCCDVTNTVRRHNDQKRAHTVTFRISVTFHISKSVLRKIRVIRKWNYNFFVKTPSSATKDGKYTVKTNKSNVCPHAHLMAQKSIETVCVRKHSAQTC